MVSKILTDGDKASLIGAAGSAFFFLFAYAFIPVGFPINFIIALIMGICLYRVVEKLF